MGQVLFPAVYPFWLEAMFPSPLYQFWQITAANLCNRLAARKPLIKPIMSDKGDISTGHCGFPRAEFLSVYAKCHLYINPLHLPAALWRPYRQHANPDRFVLWKSAGRNPF